MAGSGGDLGSFIHSRAECASVATRSAEHSRLDQTGNVRLHFDQLEFSEKFANQFELHTHTLRPHTEGLHHRHREKLSQKVPNVPKGSKRL